MKIYDSILFDADGTLFDFEKGEQTALKQTLLQLGHPYSEKIGVLYSEINQNLWNLYEKGAISQEDLKTRRFQELFDSLSLAIDGATANQIYMIHLGNTPFLLEGAEEICAYLAERYPLSLVTNGVAQVQHSRFSQSALVPYFSHIFISGEIGVQKPKVQYFDYVFETLGIDQSHKEHVLIIGDSLTSDIKGGNLSGIDTCWYNPKHLPNQTDAVCTYEITNLIQLRQIV